MDLGEVPARTLVAPAATEWSEGQLWRCVQCPHSALGLPGAGMPAKQAQALWEALGARHKPIGKAFTMPRFNKDTGDSVTVNLW